MALLKLVTLFLVGVSLVQSLLTDMCEDDSHEVVDLGDFTLDGSNYGEKVDLLKVNRDKPPSVTLLNAEPDELYLVAMVDPDAPSKENNFCESWLHWIRRNIKGRDLQKGDILSSGETVEEYKPPSPPLGKDNVHRYFIFVFKQTREMNESKNWKGRCKFDIVSYKDKNGLKCVAVNMFKTEPIDL